MLRSFLNPCFSSVVRPESPSHPSFARAQRWAGFLLLAATVFAGGARAQQPADRVLGEVDSTRFQVLTNHHPLWANAANDLGAAPADRQMTPMTLVLARPAAREAAFQALLAEQQNLASPQFHHWLTPAEVGERFGLSDHDLAALTGWLQASGLQVNRVSNSRVFITFSGAAADVGRAFQTQVHRYMVNGEERLSVSSDPRIPQALAPAIKAIHGLYTIDERPHSIATVQSAAPLATSSNGSHFMAPADFATIYSLPSSWTGAGQTIGIAGRSRTNFADFSIFRSRTNATFPNPTEVVPTAYGGVDPGPALTAPPTNSTSADDQSEATLDVLRAGSTAPGAQLLLVVATKASGGIEADGQYLVDTTPVPAQVMSISFGSCESSAGLSGVTYWDSLFQQGAAEGISSFVSSGDSGASGCDTQFTTPPASPSPISPNYICSSSYVTCVDGTEFNDTANPSLYWSSSSNASTLESAYSYIPEGGWNEPMTSPTPPATPAVQIAASGGGVSAFIATPSWQSGTGVPSARAGRYTPDVSFSASNHDGYYGCFAAGGGSCVTGSNGTYMFVGFSGTSAAAPAMAGVAALLDQKRGAAQGNLNPGIYTTAVDAPTAFNDVTVASSGVSSCNVNTPSMCNNSAAGTTGLTGGQAGYLVTAGYDEVTGLGSLNIGSFLNSYTVSTISAGSFTVAGASLTVARGATTGNTSAITVTPAGGFTGSVTLTATLATGPSGYNTTYQPAFTFGSTSPCTITNASGCTATLTVATTAATTGALSYPQPRGLPWYAGGGTALACILLCGISKRRRSLRNLLGMAILLAALAGAFSACGGGSGNSGGGGGGGGGIAGTTAGTYTATVTATSGVTSAQTTVTINVQ
jgi:subtilase family serine protease